MWDAGKTINCGDYIGKFPRFWIFSHPWHLQIQSSFFEIFLGCTKIFSSSVSTSADPRMTLVMVSTPRGMLDSALDFNNINRELCSFCSSLLLRLSAEEDAPTFINEGNGYL